MKHKLGDIKNTVIQILNESPETRKSDDLLYMKVCQRYNEIGCKMTFEKFFCNRGKYDYPSYESVSRARRKAQEQYKDLRADARCQTARLELEKEHREFFGK